MSKAQADQEVWFMSNRQPWVFALTDCGLTSKTRSPFVTLSPRGSIVFLHASKALWRGWENLVWVDVYIHEHEMTPKDFEKSLVRGAVLAVARVRAVGFTDDVMPESDFGFFDLVDIEAPWCLAWCGGEQTVVFEDIHVLRTPIFCRGAQVPTRKVPPEVLASDEVQKILEEMRH